MVVKGIELAEFRMYASCNYLETYWQRAASMRRSPLPDLPALRIVDEEPLGGTHEDVSATVLTKCVDLNSP